MILWVSDLRWVQPVVLHSGLCSAGLICVWSFVFSSSTLTNRKLMEGDLPWHSFSLLPGSFIFRQASPGLFTQQLSISRSHSGDVQGPLKPSLGTRTLSLCHLLLAKSNPRPTQSRGWERQTAPLVGRGCITLQRFYITI